MRLIKRITIILFLGLCVILVTSVFPYFRQMTRVSLCDQFMLITFLNFLFLMDQAISDDKRIGNDPKNSFFLRRTKITGLFVLFFAIVGYSGVYFQAARPVAGNILVFIHILPDPRKFTSFLQHEQLPGNAMIYKHLSWFFLAIGTMSLYYVLTILKLIKTAEQKELLLSSGDE